MQSNKNVVGNELNLYTSEMDFRAKSFKSLIYPFKIIYSFEARRKMKKIIKKFKPDVIHLNNINFQLTPSIIQIAYKMKVPIVQTVHDYQMICPNHLLFSNNKICNKCISSTKWNCAKYNCIHGSKLKSIIGTLEGILYTKILHPYEKIDKYICPSDFLKNKLLEANKIYDNKTITMCNFMDLKQDYQEYKKENYVLFFGRLSEEKGIEILLEACKELPNIKFKIAGSGPLEEKCKGISNVEYVGFKTGKELEDIIGKAKFSVYPSIWYENCPLSILESQSLGTPVVTANYGGMKELVEDEKTGILIEEMTKENLKNEIYKLYNNDNKIDEMSKECVNKRNKIITLEKYCNRLIEIYNETIDNSEISTKDEIINKNILE